MSSATQVAVPRQDAVSALLIPISGDKPAGENLQYSGLHDEIREARRTEEALEQGEWKRETKAADWHEVERLATDALTTRTKDLQVSVWLAEALVKLYGFEGMSDALRLTRGMLENFWEELYPEIDEGDLEARANALAWLDRQLALAVKEVPITDSPTGAAYPYLQYEYSKDFDIPDRIDDLGTEELQRISEMRERASREGKVTGDQWRLAKNATARAFYEQTFSLLDRCWQEFHALDTVMDKRFAAQTPGLGALKKALDELRSFIEKIVKEKRAAEPDKEEAAALPADAGAPGAAGAPRSMAGSSGPIRSREEAFKRLTEVAEYFHKAEPHNPVAYLVERAIKWGQMPLDGWLEDVIKNADVLHHLRETLGLKMGE